MLLKTPWEINRDYKSFKRFLKILETMASYGFYDLADSLRPNRNKMFHRAKHSLENKSRSERVRLLLDELGPTFVKFGQVLSTRPDLISKEYADELAKLTEHVSPFPVDEVRRIIEKELGKPVKELFADFSKQPIGSASVGQVHSATLSDGAEVVIKVQRPGIHEVVEVDLSIMRYIARKLENFDESIARYQPVRIVEEFAYSLRRELNYQFEAANLLRFQKDMANQPNLVVPKVYLELTTGKVLTMEKIKGDSAGKVLTDPAIRAKYDLPQIANIGVNSLLCQIFEHGFFHADPHPGNIFLMNDNKLAFIDFGMMGRVSEVERGEFVKIIDYMLRSEISLMCNAALRMTVSGKIVGSRMDFERDAADLVDENINLPLDKLSVSHILQELMDLLNRYQLALKPNLYMMFKALMTIEHLGREFDPGLQIIELVKPFVKKMKLRSFNPKPYLLRFLDSLGDNINALQGLPISLQNICRMYEKGRLTLRVEHHRLDDIEQTLYVTGERLSRSMLVAALIIGSALIVVAKVPPFLGDIPLIGMAGFILAGFLSIYILIEDHIQRRKFLRDKKMRKRIAEEEER